MATTTQTVPATSSSGSSAVAGPGPLSDEMLQRFLGRATRYDAEERFFAEDFEELRQSGYLRAAIPRELGGLGMTLAETCQLQRRLGYYAPADALAVNMHLYWTGLVADLWRAGDRSLEWLLTAAADGAVLAAGHAESGNDIPLLLSTTRAERVDGGYRFHGRKSFGSLSPVWTLLGVHGMDNSDPAHPMIVHGFASRDTEGLRIEQTWDVLGMRATRSEDTVLDGVFIPDRFIARRVSAGAAGIDAFVLGIYAWALLGFGNVYYGLARRALDLTVESVKRRSSIALTRSMAYHAGVQHGVAEMVLELQAVGPHLDRVADDWSRGVDDGSPWPLRIIAAKHHAVEASWRVVDQALDLAGGFGIFRNGPFERLFRDARLGRIHPANSMLTYELAAKLTLGINPDEQPRWG